MVSKREHAKASELENLKFIALLIGAFVGVYLWGTGFPLFAIPVIIGVIFMFIVFWHILDEGQEKYSET